MADPQIPVELVLPIPDSPKEEDLYKTIKDYGSSINDCLEVLKENTVDATVAGDGLTDTSNTFSVNVDDTTIEISGDDLVVKAIDGALLEGLGNVGAGAGVIPAVNLDVTEYDNPNPVTISSAVASGAADNGAIWIQYT